ncbi:MAG: hypothetical protein ACKO0Z_10325 [Betaproteobacteria bacterium]
MTDEERLHMITEQLLIVRDNLFRGMSKSIQKLQARSINEVLELENFTRSHNMWVGLTDEEYAKLAEEFGPFPINQIEAILKEKNT